MSSSRATPLPPGTRRNDRKVKVVLFSGGRDSQAPCTELVGHPGVDLTLAINGYDDGMSTGEIRRFLGDSLGPSDFRKNAARLATLLQTCAPALTKLLETRLPENAPQGYGQACLRILEGHGPPARDSLQERLASLMFRLEPSLRDTLSRFVRLFRECPRGTHRPFCYSDCSIGNVVFAGCFLSTSRDFNAALADYSRLFGLPEGLVENVTDGTNAFLVAVGVDGRVLGSEAEIVDATSRNEIRDIFLVDRRISDADRDRLQSADRGEVVAFFEKPRQRIGSNSRLLDAIRCADLIIYSPGTQHSSLYPSYLTPGLGKAIAGNLEATKLLITNIHEDAGMPGNSAVEIIDGIVY